MKQDVPFRKKLKTGKTFSLEVHQCLAIDKMMQPVPNVYGTKGRILAAVMGAGKTVMALTVAMGKVKRGPDCLPSLWVCSRTLLDMVEREGVHKFFEDDSIKVLRLHGSAMSKGEIKSLDRSTLLKYDLVITTYDFIVRSDKETGASKDVRVMGVQTGIGLDKNRLNYIEKRTRAQADNPKATGRSILFKTPWPFVVADEPQRFANHKTLTFQAMMSIYGEEYLCLTGTPTRNYTTDIWSLFRWMGYAKVKVPKARKNSGGWALKLLEDKCRTNHCLNDLLIRIKSEDVPPLPAKHVHTIHSELVGRGQEINYNYLSEAEDAVLDAAKKKANGCWEAGDNARVLAAFTRLRELSVAPYLTNPEAKRAKNRLRRRRRKCKSKYKTPEELDETTVDVNTAGSFDPSEVLMGRPELLKWNLNREGEAGMLAGKTRKLVKLIKNLPQGEKALIFSGFTSAIDLMSAALNKKGIRTLTLDGDVKPKDRVTVIEEFQESQDVRALFLTYPVGAEGLNLMNANHVVLIESWWNSAIMDQAVARAWRRGQDREVHVYHLVTKRTIEPAIVKICEDKRILGQAVLGDRKLTDFTERKRTRLSLKTIGQIIKNTKGDAKGDEQAFAASKAKTGRSARSSTTGRKRSTTGSKRKKPEPASSSSLSASSSLAASSVDAPPPSPELAAMMGQIKNKLAGLTAEKAAQIFAILNAQ